MAARRGLQEQPIAVRPSLETQTGHLAMPLQAMEQPSGLSTTARSTAPVGEAIVENTDCIPLPMLEVLQPVNFMEKDIAFLLIRDMIMVGKFTADKPPQARLMLCKLSFLRAILSLVLFASME